MLVDVLLLMNLYLFLVSKQQQCIVHSAKRYPPLEYKITALQALCNSQINEKRREKE